MAKQSQSLKYIGVDKFFWFIVKMQNLTGGIFLKNFFSCIIHLYMKHFDIICTIYNILYTSPRLDII